MESVIEFIKERLGRRRYNIIDPGEYGAYSGDFPIASAESSVYIGKKDGEPIVLKVYRQGDLTEGDLRACQTITLLAAEFLKDQSISLRGVDGQEVSFFLEMVPIRVVGSCRNSVGARPIVPCAVSKYIEGNDIQLLLDRRGHLKEEDLEFLQIFTLENEPDLRAKLGELSSRLNENLKTKGVCLLPWNIKPKRVDGKPILVITDLYGDIQKLKERNYE